VSVQLNRAQLVRSLRNIFGFVGDTNFEVGELITPTVNLGDLDAPPFHSKKGGVGSGSQAAVAAQFATVAVTLAMVGPSRSLFVVVRAIHITTASALPIQCRVAVINNLVAAAYASSSSQVGSWDSIIAETALDVVRPEAQISLATPAAVDLSNNSSLLTVAAPRGAVSPPTIVTGPFVIRPGNGLMVQNAVANNELSVGFYWDEYYL
jgi:hypothetical protein